MIITYTVGFYCFDWPIALCLPVSEGLSAWPIHFNGTLTEVLCDIVLPSIPPRGLVRMMVGYRLGIDWRKVEPNGIKYPILTRYRPLFYPIKSAREGLRSIQQPLPSMRQEAPSACGLGSNPTSLELLDNGDNETEIRSHQFILCFFFFLSALPDNLG